MRIAKGMAIQAWLPRDTAMALVLVVVDGVFRSQGFEAEITSGMEGTHMRASAHYRASALDFRILHVPEGMWQAFRDDIADRLGVQFDVILVTQPPHIHVEWDPKTGPC